MLATFYHTISTRTSALPLTVLRWPVPLHRQNLSKTSVSLSEWLIVLLVNIEVLHTSIERVRVKNLEVALIPLCFLLPPLFGADYIATGDERALSSVDALLLHLLAPANVRDKRGTLQQMLYGTWSLRWYIVLCTNTVVHWQCYCKLGPSCFCCFASGSLLQFTSFVGTLKGKVAHWP